jgi:hypothetical protein
VQRAKWRSFKSGVIWCLCQGAPGIENHCLPMPSKWSYLHKYCSIKNELRPSLKCCGVYARIFTHVATTRHEVLKHLDITKIDPISYMLPYTVCTSRPRPIRGEAGANGFYLHYAFVCGRGWAVCAHVKVITAEALSNHRGRAGTAFAPRPTRKNCEG